ncbi:MAG: hypothetical protein KGQ41_08640 [Alphaproteobacteria bacterium]|nr:hypothetical protein [Alphaproteobacteria bacterium]
MRTAMDYRLKRKIKRCMPVCAAAAMGAASGFGFAALSEDVHLSMTAMYGPNPGGMAKTAVMAIGLPFSLAAATSTFKTLEYGRGAIGKSYRQCRARGHGRLASACRAVMDR